MICFVHMPLARRKIEHVPSVHSYVSSFPLSIFHSLTPVTVAFVQDIVPLDPQKPRIIKLTVESSLKRVNEYAEFDTEESAREWRRETIGTYASTFIKHQF